MQKGQHKRKFKLKIKEYKLKGEDRDLLIKHYQHLREMNRIAKRAGKDLQTIFINEVKDLRQKLISDYAYRFYNVSVHLGPHKHEHLFPYYPEVSEINTIKNDLLKKISKGREDAKRFNYVAKEFQGMQYSMVAPLQKNNKDKYAPGTYGAIRQARYTDGMPVVEFIAPTLEGLFDDKKEKSSILPGLIGGGATFEKPNSIVTLMGSEAYRGRIRRAKRPYDKSNFVGVELEIITKVPREVLDEHFIKAKLAGNVYVKTDGSIRTENKTDVAHEVTLIAKDNQINDIINRVCKVINSSEINGYVNNTCGLHVHLDMRNRDPKLSYHNLKQSVDVLSKMVPPDRTDSEHGKKYCALTCSDTFELAVHEGTRYRAVNAVSYQTHRTIEIRLHSGSTNSKKINSWVNILLAIANKTVKVENKATVDTMQENFGISDELLDYIKLRTKKFEDRSWDTRKDHFDATA